MEKLNLEGKRWSLESLEAEVNKQIKAVERKEKAIRESKEPRLNVPGQKDWEIKQARGIFESNIKEIDRKYRELGQVLIEDQKEVVRREKTYTPSQLVKDKVDGLIADTNFYFVTARNESEKKAAINELSESMEHLSNAEKLYMRRQIPQLMDMVKDSETPTKGAVRGIAEKLKEAKTEEEGALELLEREVASGPLTEHRIKLIAEQAAEQSRQEWEGLGDTLHDKRFEVEYTSI